MVGVKESMGEGSELSWGCGPWKLLNLQDFRGILKLPYATLPNPLTYPDALTSLENITSKDFVVGFAGAFRGILQFSG